jgi:AcrR family transcriptional regulator
MEKGETRTERKKSEAHDKIIESASQLFIERGARSVSMDEIAERADMARRTLFNHFSTKDALLYAVAAPILEDAIALAEDRLGLDGVVLDVMLDLCFVLYKRHGRRLELLFAFELEDSPTLATLHRRYLGVFKQLIQKISGETDSRIVGKLVYRMFVPLLRSLEGEDDIERRFHQGMRGLIAGALLK